MNTFRQEIQNRFLLFDGAMGTMLQQNGMGPGELPERYNLEHPEILGHIHTAYIESGCDCITTNTFGANEKKLKEYGLDDCAVIEAGIKLAKQAAGACNRKIWVAQDIGPIGELLRPLGPVSFDEAYRLFARQVLAGVKYGADLFLIETMTDLYEMKAALLAVKENSDKPVICSMTFEENGRTFTGCSVSAMALTLEGLGADALGINCSQGPEQLRGLVSDLTRATRLPVLVQANAGLPDPVQGQLCYDIGPEEYAGAASAFLPLGVTMLGGCCGTTPDYTALLGKEAQRYFTEHAFSASRVIAPRTAVCSPSQTVVLDMPRIVGERINPTGKKRFQQALRQQDMDYILRQATEQADAGAEILDINVGLPELDEPAMMQQVVSAVQAVVGLPLQLDSTDPLALEKGLRAYNGKCIVNSVNGDDEVLDRVLPLVKKYGACVIGLTLDKAGIPDRWEERLSIARHILEKAEQYGIAREDVLIDCLVLTASAQQKEVFQTLAAVRQVRDTLGCKTVLGVSNVSFGLPAREGVNRTFLAMALMQGLDLAIINPNIRSMTQTVLAYRVLANQDPDARDFIEFEQHEQQPAAVHAAAEMDLNQAVRKGLGGETAALVHSMIDRQTPVDEIINVHLIPALDLVGADFEKGNLFLPQLIQAAEAAKSGFAVIQEHLAQTGAKQAEKGPILLATVEGDIHDIGKNIVKVILENYGYRVIDLGKSVPVEQVVQAAQKYAVKLVGLSALMTTTLASMEKTIAALRASGCKCNVMVGGAVLTAEYAAKIGADDYAKDAQAAVQIAKKIFADQ